MASLRETGNNALSPPLQSGERLTDCGSLFLLLSAFTVESVCLPPRGSRDPPPGPSPPDLGARLNCAPVSGSL